MNQELYIDGKLMDVDSSTFIQLDIKSNLFEGIDGMTSNRTYTFKLPKTVHNMTVFGRADIISSCAKTPYIFHVCRYLVGGVEIISEGRVTLVGVSDSIEIVIYWGVFPSLTALQESDKKLNELESDEHLLYTANNELTDYSEARKKGIFYAEYNPYKMESDSGDWKQGSEPVTPSTATDDVTRSGTFGGGGSGGSSSDDTDIADSGTFGNKNLFGNPVQPCVTCKWVLDLVKADTGVDFRFDKESRKYINSLAIPLIARKADENTVSGALDVRISDTSTLGLLGLVVLSSVTSFGQKDGDLTNQLDVTTACELTFDVSMIWSWDASTAKPQGTRSWTDADGVEHTEGFYTYYGNYIEVKIVSKHTEGEDESKYTKYYYVGGAERTDDGKITNTLIQDSESNKVNGRFSHKITGGGKISLTSGDIITFTMCNTKGTLRGLKCTDGTIKASLVDSDEVPFGGMFPIAKNLPDIKIMDFVKFLCLVTGTFPMQVTDGGSVTFVPFGNLWNSPVCINWSRKLIPRDYRNTPREMSFSLGNYCRKNWYKWKEDDTVSGDHDISLDIDNETLDGEQDIWTIPFAATDGNRIPIFEANSTSGTFAGTGSQTSSSTSSGGQYSACKDRIMNLSLNDSGKAMLSFDINLEEIFKEKYANIKKAIEEAHVLTEWFYLSPVDLMAFREDIPIYLEQYAATFAVIELKTTDSGYTEATLVKLD